MGAACPLLVFSALRSVSRPTALIAGVLVALSGISYVYAKELLAEQPYLFWMLCTIASVARFLETKRPRYSILAMASGFVAMMLRNEGLYIVTYAFVIMMASVWRNRRRRRTLVVSGAVVAVLTLGWSAERASILGHAELIGSLSNYGGTQLFARVYRLFVGDPATFEGRTEAVAFWDCLSKERVANCRGRRPIIMVRLENGPATRQFATLLHTLAVNRGIDPQKYVADYFDNPWDISTEYRELTAQTVAIDGLGLLHGDELLWRVFFEAIRAHPVDFAFSIATDFAWYFGISVQDLIYRFTSTPTDGIVFANWVHDSYEALPNDNGWVAQHVLTPMLWRKYQQLRAKPTSALELNLHQLGQTTRNVIRNAVGVALIFMWPALFWARPRLPALFLVGCLGINLAIYSIVVYYDPRYEHAILPLMIIVAALVGHVIVRTWRIRHGAVI